LKNIEEYPVPSPQGALDGGLRSLFRLGADVSVVACNTAHYWLGERAINEALGRFAPKQMSLVDMLGQSLQDRGVERVAVMATTGTTDARIYQDALAARGIEVVDFAREEVETVHSAIYDDIKAGHVDRAVDRLRAVVDAHPDVTIALCCTELGLALNPTRTPEYFDSGRLIDNNVVSPMLVLDRLLDEIPVQRPSNPPDPRAPAR
jgi:aspartate racemase